MQHQYFSIALLEDEDGLPEIEVDTTVIAPQVVLKIGNLNIHMTPERLAELGTAAINGAMKANEEAGR